MRTVWGALLLAAVVGSFLSAAAFGQNAGPEDDVESRLRAGALRSMRLGDTVEDFRKQYGVEVQEEVHKGRLAGYYAQVLDEDYADSSGRFEAFFGPDGRVNAMTVHYRPHGRVTAEGVAAQLAEIFGPPTEIRDFGERSVISWGDETTEVSMLVGLRWMEDVGRTTIDIQLLDVRAGLPASEGSDPR